MLFFVAFLIAIFFAFLPDLAKARWYGFGAAALCSLAGFVLLLLQRWRKSRNT